MTAEVHVLITGPRGERRALPLLHRSLARRLAAVPGLKVALCPHLYDLAPQGPTLEYLRSVSTDLVVVAELYPRAAFWLLDAHGIRGRMGRTSSLAEGESLEALAGSHRDDRVAERTVWCFDLRRYPDLEPLVREVLAIAGQESPATAPEDAAVLAGPADASGPAWDEIAEPAVPRWYPVIDFHLCTDCMECLNFCLFGVYGVDAAGRPWVEQPDACRPGCPACARICPAGAIMFPQHADPAIAGDPHAARTALRLDLSQVLRGLSPADLAALERARALAQSPSSSEAPAPQGFSATSAPVTSSQDAGPSEPAPESAPLDLDTLVDHLDKLDL